MVSKRSRRSEKSEENTLKPAALVKPAGAALGAALVGVGVWAGIALATKDESGWMAVVVGAVAGLAVRVTATTIPGPVPGGLAAAVAVVTGILGTILVTMFITGPSAGGSDIPISDFIMTHSLAVEIATDRTAKNQKVAWPAGVTLKSASSPSDFPKDIWDEAQKKFAALGSSEKHALRKKEEAKVRELLQPHQAEAKKGESKSSFSFGMENILYVAVGAAAAFGLGARLSFRKAKDDE